jgi:hypothetical protein
MQKGPNARPTDAEEALHEREVLETIIRIGQLLSTELDQQRLVQAVTDAATELTAPNCRTSCGLLSTRFSAGPGC